MSREQNWGALRGSTECERVFWKPQKAFKEGAGAGEDLGRQRSEGPGRGTKAQLCPSAPNCPEDQPHFLCRSLVSYSLPKSYPHFSPVLLWDSKTDTNRKPLHPVQSRALSFCSNSTAALKWTFFTKRKLPHSQRRPDWEETHPKDPAQERWSGLWRPVFQKRPCFGSARG